MIAITKGHHYRECKKAAVCPLTISADMKKNTKDDNPEIQKPARNNKRNNNNLFRLKINTIKKINMPGIENKSVAINTIKHTPA